MLAGAMLLAADACAQGANVEFTINGRAHSLPATTPVQIDGQAAVLGDVRALPNGMHLEWAAAARVGEGAVATPVFSYSLIGPVTATAPLAVLGQALTLTADTTLANISLPVNLPLGTPVVVAGLVDANGSTLATLVERRAQAGNTFLLTGPVLAVDAGAGTVTVGTQRISSQGVAFAGCAAAVPAVGEFVSLRAAAVPTLPPGAVLGGVSSARCVSLVPPGAAGASGFLQGLVSAVPSAQRFDIGTLVVTVSAQTQFVFGAQDDLDPGVAVSVEGSYLDANTFAAAVVEFIRPVVRFEAPMVPADVDPGQALRPFGVLVRRTAQVRDEDGILGNGLAQPRQVEVRGYLDRVGRAYATRVRERGNPDPSDVRLRGPVELIAPPMLQVQGLQVDTTGATFADELGAPMTREAFFLAVAIAHEVDVSGALWTASTRSLSGGLIVWIGAEPLPAPRATAGSAIHAGTASGYSTLTPLFVDGFDG